jgi:hypothetical protein
VAVVFSALRLLRNTCAWALPEMPNIAETERQKPQPQRTPRSTPFGRSGQAAEHGGKEPKAYRGLRG